MSSAGFNTFKDKTCSMPCFYVINGDGGNRFEKTRNPVIYQNFKIFALYNLIIAVFQLIQSQPQPGTSSTIS